MVSPYYLGVSMVSPYYLGVSMVSPYYLGVSMVSPYYLGVSMVSPYSKLALNAIPMLYFMFQQCIVLFLIHFDYF